MSCVNCKCVNIAAGVLFFEAEEKGTELKNYKLPKYLSKKNDIFTTFFRLNMCFGM